MRKEIWTRDRVGNDGIFLLGQALVRHAHHVAPDWGLRAVARPRRTGERR
jgi:hypothetical protein